MIPEYTQITTNMDTAALLKVITALEKGEGEFSNTSLFAEAGSFDFTTCDGKRYRINEFLETVDMINLLGEDGKPVKSMPVKFVNYV
jgi:hypothetical protein